MSPTQDELKHAIAFWKKCALDNLKTAEAMLKGKRYNFAMFMCHQTLECALKALYVFVRKDRPPYVHKLPRLLNELEFVVPKNVDRVILEADAHYIKTRYLEDRFNTKIYNRKNAFALFGETKEALKWLLDQLN